MSNDEFQQSHATGDADSYIDAFAAIALILIAVAAAVFWVSQQ